MAPNTMTFKRWPLDALRTNGLFELFVCILFECHDRILYMASIVWFIMVLSKLQDMGS